MCIKKSFEKVFSFGNVDSSGVWERDPCAMIFQGQTHLVFQHKKKRKKLVSKEKVKCGRTAWPNGLASRVEHHLVKGKKGNRLCKHRIQHLFLPQERNNRGAKTAKQTEEGGNEETA